MAKIKYTDFTGDRYEEEYSSIEKAKEEMKNDIDVVVEDYFSNAEYNVEIYEDGASVWETDGNKYAEWKIE